MKGFTILKKSQVRVDPVLINKVEELVNKDFTEDAKKAAQKNKDGVKNQRKKARKAEAKKMVLYG